MINQKSAPFWFGIIDSKLKDEAFTEKTAQGHGYRFKGENFYGSFRNVESTALGVMHQSLFFILL